ncbi:hypothetical protein [Mangrovicoccus algicola]|uniref:Uncharacterized protein n=1 Tax=Mangrovicoccus algicola TaxID=2771008 RepID=A0A8J6YYM1_9RHOB|nr:hypothetical protein [Mangrovicoccus algicola]MBE3640367.1 hypothetical protein [Mangrovicoccus algicola]
MLHFAIGLSIGFLIVSPFIAIVVVAGLMSRRDPEAERPAPRSGIEVATPRAGQHPQVAAPA